MTIIFPQTTDGETITIPAGTHTGTVRITKHDVTFQGAGVDVSIVKSDGDDARVFHAPSLINGEPCRKVTLRDLTIDCDRLASLTAAVLCSHNVANPLGPLEIVMERVKVTNHHRNTVAVWTADRGDLTDVEIVGNGGGVSIGGSTQPGRGARIRNLTVTGAQWAAQLIEQADGSVGVVPGFDVEGATCRHDYWANPLVGETMTPVAFGAQYVDVASHTEDERSTSDVLRVLTPIGTHQIGETLTAVEKWDRLETDDGEWTQVMSVDDGVATLDTWRDAGYWTPISEPSGTATIYRVTLGRLQSWTSTRLSLVTVIGTPTAAHWRTVEDDDAGTPTIVAGSRLDIIRAASGLSGSLRNVNIQPIHATKACRAARIANCTVTGSFADSFSIRGTNGLVEDCRAVLGQDMGFTVDVRQGAHLVRRCVSRGTGVAGFTIFGDHGVRMEKCEAYDSGFYTSANAGWGVKADTAASGSYVEIVGSGNRNGLASGVRVRPGPIPAGRQRLVRPYWLPRKPR